MARMEIREVENIGTAIVPGMVCVGEFAQFYGHIAGNDNLPKKVRKTKKVKNVQPTSVVVLGHFEQPEQLRVVRQSCKGRFREMGTENHGRMWDKSRNGRKPRYKDHIGRVGKAGEMRGKYKRPTEINLAT